MKLEECRNFSEVLYYQSEVNPERIFIYDIRSERAYTFGEFNSIVERTANLLLSKGIAP